MHQYVRTYDALTDSPDISPVEHLEMLRLRDEVATLAERGVLDQEEQKLLAEADRRLANQARAFAQSIANSRTSRSYARKRASTPPAGGGTSSRSVYLGRHNLTRPLPCGHRREGQ